MFRNESGQVGIWTVVSVGAALVIGFAGSLLTQNNLFSNKIETVKTEVSTNAERTAKLEEAITTLKIDNAEIKRDIKTILQILK